MRILLLVITTTIGVSIAQQALDDGGETEFYPSSQPGLCNKKCACAGPSPRCAPGVSLIMDGCGCCKVCARQRSEVCNEMAVCDKHRGLHCDMETGTCKASPGRNCMIKKQMYNNSDSFQPSCRLKCWCIDGSIGCLPLCKPPPPPTISVIGCNYPRYENCCDTLVTTEEHCCGEWRCPINDTPPKGQYKAKQDVVIRKGDCMVQTTDWSECSKTCGFGLSDKVSNDNDECKLKRETRLCMIRPCTGAHVTTGKRNRSCRRTMFRRGRIRFTINGCRSSSTYKPKYCTVCKQPGRCCKPVRDHTIQVLFVCDGTNGSRAPSSRSKNGVTLNSFVKKVMWITKCSCDETCPHENDIFAYAFRSYGKDTS